MTFHLNAQDDNDDFYAYLTKPTLFITRATCTYAASRMAV